MNHTDGNVVCLELLVLESTCESVLACSWQGKTKLQRITDPSGFKKKKDSCPTNSRQEVSRVKNLKITSPESECLVSPNFPWPGKGSWENQISSGEAASVSEVGLGNTQERSSRLTKKEK